MDRRKIDRLFVIAEELVGKDRCGSLDGAIRNVARLLRLWPSAIDSRDEITLYPCNYLHGYDIGKKPVFSGTRLEVAEYLLYHFQPSA